ncbi:MAG: short chain dehydrogenase [Gammaproteobacteria bacterium]|nr:MAG: short chain dehydrogenase [Pseudomonadota bacterium]PIE38797.1 MAG: short chain dehydrogenase [Gammaproteobacteria bacterium]
MARSVFITGASAGIGKGLALEFASRGYNLALSARRSGELGLLAAEVERRFPDVKVACKSLDVNRFDDVYKTVNAFAEEFDGLDIVVANAGTGGGGAVGSGRFSEDVSVINTNVLGAMATIDAAVGLFKMQTSGQVVAISSVAAFRGMPSSASYCASKAAISTYMEALEVELHHSGIKVTTLYPGYIDTAINQKLKSRPFLVDVAKGSRIMVDLIEKGVARSTVPVYPWNIVGRLLRFSPVSFLAGKKQA